MLVHPDNPPLLDTRFNAHVVWMTDTPLNPGKQYYIKQTTKVVTGWISQIHHRIDVNTLDRRPADHLKLNGIALCELSLNAPLAFDAYARCKGTGSFIIIDRLTNVTVGAGLIVGLAESTDRTRRVTPQERAARFGQKAVTLWLSGDKAWKLAYQLERMLFDLGHAAAVLDDEALRPHVASIAQALNNAGLICISILKPPAVQDHTTWSFNTDDLDAEQLLRILQENRII